MGNRVEPPNGGILELQGRPIKCLYLNGCTLGNDFVQGSLHAARELIPVYLHSSNLFLSIQTHFIMARFRTHHSRTRFLHLLAFQFNLVAALSAALATYVNCGNSYIRLLVLTRLTLTSSALTFVVVSTSPNDCPPPHAAPPTLLTSLH